MGASVFRSKLITDKSARKKERNKLVLPNVQLIGAGKAGSTTLASWMFNDLGVCHGQVLPGEPSFYQKETTFFSRPDRREKGVEFYNLHYKHCYDANKEFVMDASPGYAKYPDHVHSVYKDDPNLANLKIIMIVREPIARELSLFNHIRVKYLESPDPVSQASIVSKQVGTKQKLKTFQEFTDTVLLPDYKSRQEVYNPDKASFSQSHYAMYLKRWFELFDPKQILVLSYEEDVSPGIPAKERIRKFLALPSPESETPFRKLNTQKSQYKIAKAACSAIDALRPYVEKWNQELLELLASHERPPMERKPFPHFNLPEDCALNESDILVDIPE